MKNRIITISREFGSGGRTIGKKTAEKLGIPCYDAEIIQTMVQETGFAPDYVQEAGEYAPGGFLSSAFFQPLKPAIICSSLILKYLAFNYAVVIVFVSIDFMGTISTLPTSIPIHYATALRTIFVGSFAGILFDFARTIRTMAILGLVVNLVTKRAHLHTRFLLNLC